jgi:hypothetical protein
MGDDGAPACGISERIFADIAAMKAGRPTPRKMRPMPAWLKFTGSGVSAEHR